MKKFIALIISPVIFTTSFAINKDNKTEIEIPKIQTIHKDESKNEDNAEYFDTLRKSNSTSKNILDLGQNNQDSDDSNETEICSVATTDDGESGAGLCGVPVDNNDKEAITKANDKPI